MGLLFFILQYKKKIRGHETLTHTLTKRIDEKTNQNNNIKKIDRKIQLKCRDTKIKKIKNKKNYVLPLPPTLYLLIQNRETKINWKKNKKKKRPYTRSEIKQTNLETNDYKLKFQPPPPNQTAKFLILPKIIK